jgi:beta-lactamase class D
MIVRTVGPSRAVRRRTKASVMFAALLAVPTGALHAEDAALAEIFSRHGVQGTMVLMDDGGRKSVHDDARAQRRQPAASTFKIPNTLIAVQESVATGPEHVFRWDGRVHAIASWNADQTLASAFRVSCVWCYQRLAERVGHRVLAGRVAHDQRDRAGGVPAQTAAAGTAVRHRIL